MLSRTPRAAEIDSPLPHRAWKPASESVHALVPLLDDPSRRVRDHVLVEEDEMFDLIGNGQPLRMRTLVTDEARISLYRGDDQGELFDLENDPAELHNLWDQKSARGLRAEMSERLAHRLMEYADSSPRPEAMA